MTIDPAQEASLRRLRDLIQEDVGNRGLRTDPDRNLISACAGDFAAACRSIAETPEAAVGVVTGFYIPTAHPPCGETDGPLGAVFLARALAPLGIRVVLLTDAFCTAALEAGVGLAGLRKAVPIVTLPPADGTADQYWEAVRERTGKLTHLIALERVGPSHTPASLQGQGGTQETLAHFEHLVTADHHGRCHTMRGRDITEHMCPAHLLFETEASRSAGVTSIGIGDGGNEIGMGKVPWDVIRHNIPGGAIVACRVPTDHLIVCGISNWGAYGLAAGVRLLRGQPLDGDLLNTEREREILEAMVQRGPLVDGVSNEETATVDGLSFERYIEPLRAMAESGEPRVESPTLRSSIQALDGSAGASKTQPRPPLVTQTGADVRRLARLGELTTPTVGMAMGYVHANLVALPRDLAFDFLLFCQRNPKPCPLLDVTEAGSAEPRIVAAGADVRTDLPRYCVYRDGALIDEPTDLHQYWRDDMAAFLLGCSFTFENALLDAGVPVRHIECGCNVPMYRTNIPCTPAGVFRGPMVVSMRPMTPAQAITATRVCGRFPRAHGVPVHWGDPAAIGIRDINRPDFGNTVQIRPGEVPVFWACGVTPQAVVMEVKPPLVLTHQPGCMFVTDWRDSDLEG